jgi:hypothetical protein
MRVDQRRLDAARPATSRAFTLEGTLQKAGQSTRARRVVTVGAQTGSHAISLPAST